MHVGLVGLGALLALHAAGSAATPAGAGDEPVAGPRVVAVRSSAGLELPFVVLAGDDGSRLSRALDHSEQEGLLWLRRGERFRRIAAPGHVERDLAVVDGTLVLEPSTLLVVEGDFDCVETVGGVRCRRDGRERDLQRTDGMLVQGQVDGGRWAAAVSREEADELRLWVRFRDRTYAALAFRTASLRGRYAFECGAKRSLGVVDVELERDADASPSDIRLHVESIAGSARDTVETGWGRVTRGTVRDRRDASLAPGEVQHRFVDLARGRSYRVVAVDPYGGGSAEAVVELDGPRAVVRLALGPGLVLTGRVVDERGLALASNEVRVRVRVEPEGGAAVAPVDGAPPPLPASVDGDGFFRATLPGGGPSTPRTAVVAIEARGRRTTSFTFPLGAERALDVGELVVPANEPQVVLRPPSFGALTGQPPIDSLLSVDAVEHVVFDAAPTVLWKVEQAALREGALEIRLEPAGLPHEEQESERFLTRPTLGRARYTTAPLPDGPVDAVLVHADTNVGFVRDDDGAFVAQRLAEYELELACDRLPAQLVVSWRSLPLAVEPERVAPDLHRLRFVGPRAGLVLRWRGGGTHLRPGFQRIEP